MVNLLSLSSWCLVIVVWLPPDAMGLYAVCDSGILRSYSLTILSALMVSILGMWI